MTVFGLSSSIPMKTLSALKLTWLLLFYIFFFGWLGNTNQEFSEFTDGQVVKADYSTQEIQSEITGAALIAPISIQLPTILKNIVPALTALGCLLIFNQGQHLTFSRSEIESERFTHRAIQWTRGLNRGQPAL